MEAWLQGIFADTPVLTVPWSIDYFSVIAGVLTGALFACDRKLDIIGTVVCGLITGYGGGVLRDTLMQGTGVYFTCLLYTSRADGGFGIGAQGIGSLGRGYVEIRQAVLELEVHAVVIGGVRGYDPLRLKLLRVGLLRCYGVFDVFFGLKSTRCVRRGVLVDLIEGLLEFGDLGLGKLGGGELLPDIQSEVRSREEVLRRKDDDRGDDDERYGVVSAAVLGTVR